MTTQTSVPTTPNSGGSIPSRLFAGRKQLLSNPWLIRLVTFVTLIAGWEAWAADKSRALIAPPSEILDAFIRLAFTENSLWGPVGESVSTLALGLIITLPFGIAIGIIIGRSRLVDYILDPFVSFLYVVPNVAIIPLLVLWFGFDLKLRLALVFMSAVFPLIVNTANGIKQVDDELIDGAKSLCATESQILRTVVLPGATPLILAGVRIGFSSAWVAVIVAEMTALITGVGGLIIVYANEFKTAQVFVPIICIMIIGLIVNFGMTAVHRRYTPWTDLLVND